MINVYGLGTVRMAERALKTMRQLLDIVSKI